MAAKKAQKSKSSGKSGTAQTMDELLQKTGYELKGLSRGQKIEGTVIEVSPKSLVLDIGAKSEGLVVDREFDASRDFIKKLSPGDKVQATVLIPETETGQSLLSVREAAEEEAWKALKEAEEKDAEVEARVEGSVRGGLSVTVEGVSGFIPGSHLGSQLSENPQKAVGKTVKTKVIELAREQGRVVLSEKAVSEAQLIEAQKKALEKIKEGEKYSGKVVGITGFGAFVQIEQDGVPVDGLVHLSELAWEKVEEPKQVITEGDEVEVLVIGKEDGRLALSIKQAQEDPWKDIAKKYKADSKIKGKVTKLGDFGALVQLEPGVEGLLHLSKIPAGISFNVGDEIECFIEEVDKKSRRISLGLVLKEKPVGYK